MSISARLVGKNANAGSIMRIIAALASLIYALRVMRKTRE